ncbi:LacI family DNA-binding transcriptional regulator [Dolosicoccus paucivorans]|uniref:LacI family transcriptional regulator n=1 Tax=Dolosicoccus paucivorans TaxID=84521 RepID=A0A1G8K248_9LACT|nr:LacI family DNA-binding transcriptional regulator [Dolosicoccus paucivorans]PMB84768.1 LacI family transcriptional regulator [Dolosicoccus paucivorans]PMC58206.1 LacI family transcriptional regulator [Dolosicoccus paucivorans]SDI37515.1 transcriptional regulator, LacI family [Dolosicoccus paucivorans]
MSNVTIHDVAKHAGVSATTVSRVMNNRGYISEEMRKKVHASMEALNYSPNQMARSLFKKETKFIGLIIPTTANPFFGELAFHIEHELVNQGYKLLVCNSIDREDNEIEYLKMLQENRVDGIIVGSHNIGIEEYDKISIKMVSVERKIHEDIPTIQSDNYYGGKLAAEVLVEEGCKNILCISGDPKVDTPANNRLVAYLDYMKELGYPTHKAYIPFNLSAEEKLEKVQALHIKEQGYDGVLAGDDVMASIVLNHLTKEGLNVPEDVKVVGFDGTETVRTLLPHLTTIEQDIKQLAKESVTTILKKIKDEPIDELKVVPVKLHKGTTA